MDLKDLLLEKRKKKATQAFPKTPKAVERKPVFDQSQDIHSVISSIVYEMKDDNNKLAMKWDLPWTQLKFCNVKFAGNKLVMTVEQRKGGFKIHDENVNVMKRQSEDNVRLMDKFEKAIKKEFKERTGKTLTMKDKETKCDHRLVAVNGLYMFFCIRTATISAKLDGQVFQED